MGDYGQQEDGTTPDLMPFLYAASRVVDQVVALAPSRPLAFFQKIASDTQTLELIERYLAAHFYVQSDQNLASKSTAGASGNYQGQTGKGYEGSKYGLLALRVDYSGTLDVLDKRRFASAGWIGKVPSEQIPYDERD